jgi:hypothetical protein
LQQLQSNLKSKRMRARRVAMLKKSMHPKRRERETELRQ